MTDKFTYFVRVAQADVERFEKYVEDKNISCTFLSNDYLNKIPSLMFSLRMTTEDALAVNLAFPLTGCLNLKQTFEKLRANSVAKSSQHC